MALVLLLQIIAHENSEAPCQMWSFDDHRFKPYERKQRTPDKDTEQSQKAQAITLEMKKLMDKHRHEMKEMAEVIAAKDRALRVEVAERYKTREQMKVLAGKAEWEQWRHQEELEKLERVRTAMIRTDQEQKAHILSLRNALVAAEEEAKRYRELLWRMRAQVCRWAPFSGAFRRAAFNPAPIEFGLRNNVSTFIIRYSSKDETTHIHYVQDGDTWTSDSKRSNFQVLVGDPSRLFWAPCRGRFEVKSILPKNPVPGLDKDIDRVSDTRFIGRYSHPGTLDVTGVTDGTDGIGSSRIQNYEVLCYRDL
ncbi:hypothetical protein B0H16DRAFT_852218 [Mycena metata]|uniref:Uncharacterized protein n=1 Tax=Mycena metata TaxID=1033252 RepID=A0AAD7N400_9AGAR|nr:hypothetical protein B0H16DRAFT_987696 [Mycena metata]KAJ7750652.1 hypothetical protein B0H16DRAFT_852218 [Mycena metata]